MSFNIGICEDDPEYQKEILKIVEKIARDNQLQLKLETFSDIDRLEYYMNEPLEEPLDLILLDIYFDEDETGIKFARRLREFKDNTKIIFITSAKEFALEGYTIDSKAYILKPIDPKLLKEAILRSLEDQPGKTIVIRTPAKTLTLDLNKILYFEINNKELTAYYTDSTSDTIRISLKEIKKLLPEDQFFQIHRSYIVSIPGIYSIQDHEAILLNKERIPISKRYYNDLQKKLAQWHMK